MDPDRLQHNIICRQVESNFIEQPPAIHRVRT
jgi:hypothetical protein